MSPNPIHAESIREERLRQDRSKELAEKGFYHSFELPDGTLIDGVNPLDRLRERYARFPIPRDLTGKRVLDIGAWDGWFTFEAERHGGAVTAIDCVEVDHFWSTSADEFQVGLTPHSEVYELLMPVSVRSISCFFSGCYTICGIRYWRWRSVAA